MMLRVDRIKVRYRNGALGVTDSALEVPAGKIVALFGANGAGKTTTLRSIGGFLRAEGTRIIAGRISFEERDITNFEPNRVAELGIATVVERRKIFANLTVDENLLALGARQLGADRARKMDQVFALFPVLKEKRTLYAGRLSGGQQQMLALGRSMMMSPKLLMIDEVTLGLHPSLFAPIYSAIRTIADSGASVLLVDESAASALDVVDYCYLLQGGRMVADGPPSKFRGSELLAAGYVGEG